MTLGRRRLKGTRNVDRRKCRATTTGAVFGRTGTSYKNRPARSRLLPCKT